MLGKLTKHEFIAANRYMIPLNLLVLVSIILAKIFISLKFADNTHELVIGLMLLIFVTLLIVSMVATGIFFIVRFYRNMFTDEGYLMFTLPVKPWQHIVSKGLVAFIWQCINMLLVFGSIPFLLIGNVITSSDWYEFGLIWGELMNEYRNAFGHSFTFLVFWFILLVIIGMISTLLHIYASIALGQLLGRHKIIGAVGVYFGTTFLVSTLSSIIQLFTSASYMNSLVSGAAISAIVNSTYSSLMLSLVTAIVTGIVYFVIANYVMQHKLNLD